MEAAQKTIVRSAAEHLKTSGHDIDKMVAHLSRNKIVTPKQLTNIITTDERSGKVDKFVDYMHRKGTLAFEEFRAWFQTNVDQMTYRRNFGTEEEKKALRVSDDDDDDDNDDNANEDEEEAVIQPPLKKQKSTSAASCRNEAANSKEASPKVPVKKTNKNHPPSLKKAATMHLEQNEKNAEDQVWEAVKADPQSIISPSNSTQKYRLHIGRNIFTTAGKYQGQLYFHIRRYGGDKLYPGLGVAFTKPGFKKFLECKDELEHAFRHTNGVESPQIHINENQIRLSFVENKLDIRKMLRIDDKEEGSKLVFTRCGVRLGWWQFGNLLAVIRHLDTLLPGWQDEN